MKKALKISTLYLALTGATLAFSSSATAVPMTTKAEKAAQLTPYTQRNITDEVFYFVLPDRFYNGDLTNDLGAKSDDK